MRKIIFGLLLVFSLNAISQTEEKVLPDIHGNYLGIAAGFATGTIRDFLTSPLSYTALMPAINFDYKLYCPKSIFSVNFATIDGLYITVTHDNTYIATGYKFDFDISYYRLLEGNSGGGLKNYLGLSTGNFSELYINSAFGNASSTFDNFTDLSLCLKSDWTIIKPEKQKKFLWLVKYKSKEKQYLLSGKLGVPIVSLMYRPAFTNPGNSTLNDETLFPNYSMKTKVFSGLSTDISISRILKNGNMVRFGYYWDFITSGKNALNRIDMSHHIFTVGLIYKIN
ncbi:MAG TPA: hypothetical protein PLL66_06480 [Bacteroidales bacterium]|nr:hypothetical protein [Bacteroidales bacterium]